jgi:hypothetical protein
MKNNYNFSKAERGRFYKPDIKLNIPVDLDDDVRKFVEQIATSKKKDISTIPIKIRHQAGAWRQLISWEVDLNDKFKYI